jgi:chemotaxis family two-component system sensor kinase Cph1
MKNGEPEQYVDGIPDLNTCEREPIHIPGSIERNGALIVLEEPELKVVQVSGNTGQMLGTEPRALLGTELSRLLQADSLTRLKAMIASGNLNCKRRYLSGMQLGATTTKFDASVHRQGCALILELEPEETRAADAWSGEVHDDLAGAITALDGRLSLQELCQAVAARVRHLTGFDRVMVYRFLEDDTGAVIAEDRRTDMTSYLGLRYPASDIPAQARRLYMLNSLRLKADVNAVPVPLVPSLNPFTGEPLDMTYCVLRAMSPVHVEYLKNMGVAASMSVSIVKNDRLWGLIACHHARAKTLALQIRVSCEVLAGVLSAHIGAAEEEDKRRGARKGVEFLEQLSERLRAQPDIHKTLRAEGEHLAAIMDSQGAVICIGDELALVGRTPSPDDVQRLTRWLRTSQQSYLFHTDKLSEQYQLAEVFSDAAAGVLSVRIAPGSGDFIIWFRPAALQVIEWGGNPAKPIHETEAGKRIAPRLSFERWKQTVGDRSAPWQGYQREFALSLRQNVAEELLVRRNDEVTRLNHELERSNIELDAFAYAASHDLQEPVRTIRAYAQLLNRGFGTTLQDDARDFLKFIEDSASRMSNLISALLKYGQVGGSTLRERKPVNLEDVLQLAMMNLAESIRSSAAVITSDALPTLRADPDQMSQVFQNLIGNSIKYRRLDESPRIHISSEMQGRSWQISVQDNGQGFNPEDADLIFGAFKRLHGRDVPGTGIGLALCKRIIEHQDGRIWAESNGRDQGARFSFTLPESKL